MIERDDIDRLDDIFVRRETCEANHKEIREKLSQNDTQLALIRQQLKLIIWILGVLTTTSVASVLTAIFKIILK